MRRWLGLQARALAVTALKLGRAPISTLFNVAVLGIALALPAALYLGLVNVQAVTRTVSPEPQLTVFLALDATAVQVKEIGGRLAAHPRVERILHVPRDQAL